MSDVSAYGGGAAAGQGKERLRLLKILMAGPRVDRKNQDTVDLVSVNPASEMVLDFCWIKVCSAPKIQHFWLVRPFVSLFLHKNSHKGPLK